jgi:hypothetical protein
MDITHIKSLAMSNQFDNIVLVEQLMKGAGLNKIPIDLFKTLADIGIKDENGDAPSEKRIFVNYDTDVRLYCVGYLVLQGLPLDLAVQIYAGFEDADGICEESIGGLYGKYDAWQIRQVMLTAKDYNNNIFNAGFKYIHLLEYGSKNLSKAKKIFFDMLGLTNKKYVTGHYKDDKYVVYYNDDCDCFLQFESGKVCKGGYSGLYCTNFEKGLELFKKIIFTIDYVKSVDFAYNGKVTIFNVKYPKKKHKKIA